MLPFSAPLRHAVKRDLPYQPVARKLAGWAAHTAAVALVSDGGPTGRFSYLTVEPDARMTLGHDEGSDALALLHEATAFVHEGEASMPPFSGGLIGMASFEFGARLENMARRPFRIEGRAAWPELILLRFPAVLAFDHHAQTLTAVGRGASEAEAAAACERLIALYQDTPALPPIDGSLSDGPLVTETAPEVHEDKVAALVRQIHAGDLFQANLARGWIGRLKDGVSPGDVMAALQARGPAPFGALLRLGDRAIVSNSPERFIHLSADGTLETRPIKGTRPRGATPEDDQALAAELLASAKDRAENLMIVDLMRHDLSKVAEVGSVKVERLNALETYANVHHLVSTVTAQLREGLSAAEVLAATLPAGSISGAPKVQAMKVIDTMEAARGPYCGVLFSVDAGGAMDSSVLIRTLACEHDGRAWQVRAAAGGGIVADSEPEAENAETETKLSLIRKVLEG